MQCVTLLLLVAGCASAQYFYNSHPYATSAFYGSYYNPYALTLLRKRRAAEEQLTRHRRSAAPAPAPAAAEDQQADEATLLYSGYYPSYYGAVGLPSAYYGTAGYPTTYTLPFLRKKRDLSAAQASDQQASEATYSAVYAPQVYQPYLYTSPYAYLWK